MRPSDWIEHFVANDMGAIDPRRCTVVPDGRGSSLYAALYDPSAFGSFAEFDAWIVWTTSLQPSMITDGPSSRRDWSSPETLNLPHTPLATAPALLEAMQRLCVRPELAWVLNVQPRAGRLRTATSLDCETEAGWLTFFVLADDEDDTLTWNRVDLPDRNWVGHLVSDLAINLKVDLEGLGAFACSKGSDGCRVWFKASRLLLDALDHGEAAGGGRTALQLVRALRAGESVYLPDCGQLTAQKVVDVRTGERRITHSVSFQPDTELLMDLDEAMEANTLPFR